MKKIIETALKKLLGKGRAFKTPFGFMSDFLDLLASPFVDVKERLSNLKYTHFPTINVDENNIINGEELFGISDTDGKTLEERAADIESQWSSFAGGKTYKQIETILQKKGFSVRVIENIPEEYNLYGYRVIGNGFLQIEEEVIDPVVIINGKHTFIIQADDFLSDDAIESLIKTLITIKPAQNAVYYIPRFLRKKEIHNVLTKSQMQTYKKSQYCDCRVQGKF